MHITKTVEKLVAVGPKIEIGPKKSTSCFQPKMADDSPKYPKIFFSWPEIYIFKLYIFKNIFVNFSDFFDHFSF